MAYSLIQVPQRVPPNLKFIVDDVESEWVDESYDFIHSRYMVGSIGDWPALIKRVYELSLPPFPSLLRASRV